MVMKLLTKEQIAQIQQAAHRMLQELLAPPEKTAC